MAKLSAHGNELFRYLSMRRGALIAVMEDGKSLSRTPWSGWKLAFRKKDGISLDEWKKISIAFYNRLPEWRKVNSLPSVKQLEEWVCDGICETPTGHRIEPDGTHPEEGPSWLIVFGLI